MTSKKDSVRTPSYITDAIKKEFRTKTLYDPTPFNPNFKKGVHKDALTTEWGKKGGVVFINPPYSNVSPFFAKSAEQWRKGKTIIMLCKLQNIGSKYAKKWISGAELRILSDKISFPGYGGKKPLFHNVLVIWRAGKRSQKYSVV